MHSLNLRCRRLHVPQYCYCYRHSHCNNPFIGEPVFNQRLCVRQPWQRWRRGYFRIRRGCRILHVKVKPLNISIIQDGKIRGLLYISMSLETGSRDLRDGVVNVRPKLRDAYIRTLTRYASNQMNPNKPVSIMLMKKLLQRSTDWILGDSTVTVIIGSAHVTGARM